MDWLKSLVIGMGVLIVAMMVLLAVGLARKSGAAPAAPENVVLSEPAGTHIASLSQSGGLWAVLLQGGGPDRVVLLGADGRVAGRISLQK